MSVYVCRRCGYTQPDLWEGLCPGCNGPYRAVKSGADSNEQKGQFATLGGGRVKSGWQYISTGQEGFDKVLGGGLVAGKVALLGGYPGAGKTRLLLTVADYMAKTQGFVIYASGEESEDDVNGAAASLGLVNDRVTVMGNQASVEKVLEYAKKVHAFLVIWDSAQKFMSNEASGSPGSISQCKAIGTVIKNYVGKTKTCSIIVNQMKTDGDLKGGTELEHHCDTIMVLAFPKEDDTDAPDVPQVRILANSKNRVGPENIKTYWRMSEEGRLENVPPRTKLIVMPSRRRDG